MGARAGAGAGAGARAGAGAGLNYVFRPQCSKAHTSSIPCHRYKGTTPGAAVVERVAFGLQYIYSIYSLIHYIVENWTIIVVIVVGEDPFLYHKE